MRLLFNEDFNNDILRALVRHGHEHVTSLLRVQDIPELFRKDDATILEWAAQHNYILCTHDASTMTKYAYDRLREGKRMPGIFEVKQTAYIGQVLEHMLIIIGASDPNEWENQIIYIPF